ncbi:HTH-type transcriptional regulator LeuO [Rhodobiaceae bacterium]|nr:HTH-type transcriptional regulator LeuO [Rhodobiaceae bacterium]
MKLDLNLLQVFDAVYTAGGITAAAEKLRLTQPAISNALKRLREHLDDPLFERVGKQFVPTPEADRLAPIIHEALRSIEQGLSLTDGFDPGQSDRCFSMIVPDAIEPIVLNPLLQTTLTQSPGIRFEVQSFYGVDFNQALLSKQVDLGFMALPSHEEQLNSTYLIDDETCIAVRADHPVYGERDVFTQEDMGKVGLVSLIAEMRGYTHLEYEMRTSNVQRRIISTVTRMWSIPFIVARTDLAGALARRMAETVADDLNLKLFKPPIVRPAHQWYMIWHKDNDDDPAHSWLRNEVLGIFAKLKAADQKAG